MNDPARNFRFREFPVYKDSRKFISAVKAISKQKFPSLERFGLLSQLWRAADSILLNIAEGSDRGTDKDFAHFLNTAKTSLNEVIACIDIALDNGYISEKDANTILENSSGLSDQLTAFRKKLLGSPTK